MGIGERVVGAWEGYGDWEAGLGQDVGKRQWCVIN